MQVIRLTFLFVLALPSFTLADSVEDRLSRLESQIKQIMSHSSECPSLTPSGAVMPQEFTYSYLNGSFEFEFVWTGTWDVVIKASRVGDIKDTRGKVLESNVEFYLVQALRAPCTPFSGLMWTRAKSVIKFGSTSTGN